jgi:UPF0755 protein
VTALEPPPPGKTRGLSGLQIFLICVMMAIGTATLAVGGALGAYAWVGYQIEREGPLTPDGAPRIVTLERGSGVSRIAETLEAAGVIDEPVHLKIEARLEGGAGRMQAGEYAFPSGASVADVYRQIVEGRVIQHPVTIPEGAASVVVAQIVNESAVLSGDPVAPPEEGSLLPETYMVQRGTDRAALIARMEAAQDELLAELWPGRRTDLPYETQEEAIILASVVEKETALASERPRIAAVFVNRLRRGMRLQSDPTIIYGVTQGLPLGRGIRQSEIDAVTEWNTYQIDGLPKTAIANPGRDAIAAVLNPPDSDELYFVADGRGGHAFARTDAEHVANVRRWRAIERTQASQAGDDSARVTE